MSADRLTQQRRDLVLFLDVVGHQAPMSAITRLAVRDWKQLLLELPVNATESTAFTGMTLQNMVEHNAIVGKPTITIALSADTSRALATSRAGLSQTANSIPTRPPT